MVAISLPFTKNVKVEGVNLVPDVLMIQEKLGQVAQILRVYFLLLGIELKHRECLVSVDLISRRAPDIAACGMILKLNLLVEEVETEGACIEDSSMVLRRVVCVVPGFHRNLAELHVFNCLQTSCKHEVSQFLLVHTNVLIVVQELLLLFFLFFFPALGLFKEVLNKVVVDLNHVFLNPAVHRSLLLEVVDVVLDRLLGLAHLRRLPIVLFIWLFRVLSRSTLRHNYAVDALVFFLSPTCCGLLLTRHGLVSLILCCRRVC